MPRASFESVRFMMKILMKGECIGYVEWPYLPGSGGLRTIVNSSIPGTAAPPRVRSVDCQLMRSLPRRVMMFVAVIVSVAVIMIVIVRMRVSVMRMAVIIVFVVDVLHAWRNRYGGRWLRVELPAK